MAVEIGRPRPPPRAQASAAALARRRARAEEGQGVERDHQEQQVPVARHQRRVLEHAAQHDPEQVVGERRVRARGAGECLREDQVREEDRREGEGRGEAVARALGPDGEQGRHGRQPVRGEEPEQEQIEPGHVGDADPRADQHRQEDARQDREEDEGVHEPGRAEQQREGDEAARLEEHEGGAEEEEVGRDAAERALRRDHEDEAHREGSEQRQGDAVDSRQRRLAQIEERPVVVGQARLAGGDVHAALADDRGRPAAARRRRHPLGIRMVVGRVEPREAGPGQEGRGRPRSP